MSSIIKIIKQRADLFYEKGASEDSIIKAENILKLQLSDDYKEYVRAFGAVSYSGHELTGFSTDKNLDVVYATLKNRKNNPYVTFSLYVIEETHIDGIVIWQDSAGAIYQTGYKEPPVKIFECLADYIAM